MFVISDPGRDQDDEDVLVLLGLLQRTGYVDLRGVVANLAPARQRARLAKGTLALVGAPDVPVGVGTACGQPADDELGYQFDVDYLSDDLQPGDVLLDAVLDDAPRHSLTLLLISGLTDALAAVRRDPRRFEAAVDHVVILGGAYVEAGRIRPDPTAQNNAFDVDAAEGLYAELQALGVRTTTVTRHAAVAAAVDRSVYDAMAATGHPVGRRLLAAQRQALEELWSRANLPADHPGRRGLPARCDRHWFTHTFCGGEGGDRAATDPMWDLVRTLNLYDPCALLAAIPDFADVFFSPIRVLVDDVEHAIVGLSVRQHGLRDPAALADELTRLLVESLRTSLPVR
jgi:inosine-uridine nucleoside N-ribohydrolase